MVAPTYLASKKREKDKLEIKKTDCIRYVATRAHLDCGITSMLLDTYISRIVFPLS
jgi:hypothetical protein